MTPAKKAQTAVTPPTIAPAGTAGDSGAADPTPTLAEVVKEFSAATLTAGEAIKALISTLDHDPTTVASIQITPQHTRVYGDDRSAHSHRVDWKPEKADSDA